ncbi:MAG: hypothetical protein FJZ47_18200 [Candidatus Tectomicrobia bacterium]|uniref:Uncharacterized protein n=1 Tax=Tectimicrobiota bacterium TaxID=2528274 RepID=A0A937W5V7_UNCTE|nr:hypothetical protein [Candidatus Tectomicrobia bacterium]
MSDMPQQPCHAEIQPNSASDAWREDAYHGTHLDNALRIRQQGFIPHLGIAGTGCYFDLGDDASARSFALERANGDAEQAVIIRAAIRLGTSLDFSFRRNAAVKQQFQQFQTALQSRSDSMHGWTFNETKEQFLQTYYPHVTTVLYFNERTGLWYVAVRDPQHITILLMVTLSGRSL